MIDSTGVTSQKKKANSIVVLMKSFKFLQAPVCLHWLLRHILIEADNQQGNMAYFVFGRV